MVVEKINESFTGTGEVKGMRFRLLDQNDHKFLWQIINNDSIHYEVWLKKETPICLDFSNRVYSDNEFKYSQPKSKDFGVWAWSFYGLKKAMIKFLNK